jgi:mitotic spindle assembly checkpoint protein MAD2B
MSTVDVLIEFLECVVHTVLRQRNIYPPSVFEKKLKYGVGIWKSRHPDINSYITRVLTNARQLFEQVQ